VGEAAAGLDALAQQPFRGLLQLEVDGGPQVVALHRLPLADDVEDGVLGVDLVALLAVAPAQVLLVDLLEPPASDEVAGTVVGELLGRSARPR
jgi:hypothetical protein